MQAFFPTAQIVETEFIYKIKYACEIIIDNYREFAWKMVA